MASATDKLQQVGLPGTATTLDSPGYTDGDTTLNFGSTSNMPSGTGFTFAIDRIETVNGVTKRVEGSYCEFVGVKSSPTSVAEVSRTFGDAQDYPADANTRVYIPVSSTRENRMVEWGLTHADQDGTLKTGAVDNAAVLASNVVETAKIKDANITPSKWTNPYKFSVYRSEPYTFPTQAMTVIPYDAKSYDTNNNVDVATNKGRFTAPVTGYYHFNASVDVFVAANNVFWIQLMKNGSLVAYGGKLVPTYAGFHQQFQVSKDLYLSAGDYVEAAFQHNEGEGSGRGNTTTGIHATYFEGFLVSQT